MSLNLRDPATVHRTSLSAEIERVLDPLCCAWSKFQLTSQGVLAALFSKHSNLPWELREVTSTPGLRHWALPLSTLCNCFSHVVPTLLVALLHIFEDCVSPVSLRWPTKPFSLLDLLEVTMDLSLTKFVATHHSLCSSKWWIQRCPWSS